MRLALFNIGSRLVEWSERGWLAGDALIDRVRERLQAPRTPRAWR